MDWIYLILAGVFEMLGVTSMNRLHQTKHALSYLWILGSFGASFSFLSLAMRTLPMGTAYGIWTGIGAAGGTILGMIWYGESKSLLRILCLILIFGSAIGLKLVGS